MFIQIYPSKVSVYDDVEVGQFFKVIADNGYQVRVEDQFGNERIFNSEDTYKTSIDAELWSDIAAGRYK